MPIVPTTLEVEVGKIAVQSHPRQNISEMRILTDERGMVVYAYDPSYVGGHR
jgi:predicted lipoprotein with Yx(FWY)xxD motif